MNRRRSIYLCCVAAILVSLIIVVSGCGGGGGASATSATISTGVEAVGTLVNTKSRSIGTRDGDCWSGNANYPTRYQIPSTYSVAISKFELLKGVDDATPYVIFDTGADLANAKIVDMSSGAPVVFGSNPDYPPNGTYTHVRYTLAYLEFTINCDLNDGRGYAPTKFRLYASTVGDIQDGDVLVSINGTWNWIAGGAFYPITGARPNNPTQDSGFSRPDGVAGTEEFSPDPWYGYNELPEPLVINNPSGKYILTTTFDVTTSPQAPGCGGTFAWNDVTEDGLFKPAVMYTEGGDAGDPGQGYGEWAPLAPVISVSVAKE